MTIGKTNPRMTSASTHAIARDALTSEGGARTPSALFTFTHVSRHTISHVPAPRLRPTTNDQLPTASPCAPSLVIGHWSLVIPLSPRPLSR
jgi:hypothetical protein